MGNNYKKDSSKCILVTGAAGFIGYHLCQRLLTDNFTVIGIDNFNSYYDISLKEARINLIDEYSIKHKKKWKLQRGDIEEYEFLNEIFLDYKPKIVINLAAQAGVRYSLENPAAYIKSNILGFNNILECCKTCNVENLIFASSSSVYGGNTNIPFKEENSVEHPVSTYAATKKTNELLAHTYSHLYELPCTGLRFFTVYGPWGRPDMAPMIFAKSILSNKPIKVFNYGKMSRDFTYIDDVIESISRIINKPAMPDKKFKKYNPNPSSSWAPYQIFNIGNSSSINLLDFISVLEKKIGKSAIKEFMPMQEGDVQNTAADTSKIESFTGFKPSTSIEEGIEKFINWYQEFYK